MTAPNVWWSPKHAAIVAKHPYGECYDLIERDPMGWRDTDELSALPADAVRLVPLPTHEALTDLIAETLRELQIEVSPQSARYVAGNVLALLAAPVPAPTEETRDVQ